MKYDTDPPSAQATGKPTIGNVLDVARTRAMYQAGKIDGIGVELPAPYNDDRLIAIVISLGMPRWSAEQVRGHPTLRFNYFGLAIDVEQAAKGDKPAQQRIDAVREHFLIERRSERVHDRPDFVTGYVAS